MAKNATAQNQVWRILAAYNQYGMQGQEGTPINLERHRQSKLIEAQSRYKKTTLWQNLTQGNNQEAENSPEEKAYGPVGLLIQQLHECGYQLSNDMVAMAPGEINLDIWNMPWQHLKSAIHNIAIRGRLDSINNNRSLDILKSR